MKYLNTKKGSLEEAIVKTVAKENNFIYAAKMAKKNGEKTFKMRIFRV